MNFRLREFKEDYSRKGLSDLEKRIEYYYPDTSSKKEADDIMTALISELLFIAKSENDTILITRKLLDVMKKFESNVLGDGGLQRLDPIKLEKYFGYLTKILTSNFIHPKYINSLEELRMMHKAVLERELKNYLSDADVKSSDNAEDRLNLLWAIQWSGLFLDQDVSLFSLVSKVLRREAEIDVLTGDSIDQIPLNIYTQAIYVLEKYVLEEETPESAEGKEVLLRIYH